MVAGVGPIGGGIVADAEFNQFRQLLSVRTTAPVGISGRISVSCLQANEHATPDRVLAGCAYESVIGEQSVARGMRLSFRQTSGRAFAATFLCELCGRMAAPSPSTDLDGLKR